MWRRKGSCVTYLKFHCELNFITVLVAVLGVAICKGQLRLLYCKVCEMMFEREWYLGIATEETEATAF